MRDACRWQDEEEHLAEPAAEHRRSPGYVSPKGMTPARMRGLHLTADLQGCGGSSALLVETDALALLCKRLVDEAGLSPVAEKFHAFPDVGSQRGGVTGVVLLAESHLAIHTWPECAG